jgi:hypothetical protein
MQEVLLPHSDTIKSLLCYNNLSVDFNSIQQMVSSEFLELLKTLGFMLDSPAFQKQHNYFEQTISIDDFIQNIEILLNDVLNSDLEDEDKAIFVSFLSDLQKGTRLYSIHGIDALIKALQDNLCKYTLLEEKLTGKYESFKDKTLYLIKEIAFWAKTIKSSKKSYTQLKGAISGILELEQHQEEE